MNNISRNYGYDTSESQNDLSKSTLSINFEEKKINQNYDNEGNLDFLIFIRMEIAVSKHLPNYSSCFSFK